MELLWWRRLGIQQNVPLKCDEAYILTDCVVDSLSDCARLDLFKSYPGRSVRQIYKLHRPGLRSPIHSYPSRHSIEFSIITKSSPWDPDKVFVPMTTTPAPLTNVDEIQELTLAMTTLSTRPGVRIPPWTDINTQSTINSPVHVRTAVLRLRLSATGRLILKTQYSAHLHNSFALPA